MKKNFTITALFLVLLSGFSSTAQLVTVSNANKMPVAGDIATYVNANTFGFDPAGVGPVTTKVWDYAALATQGANTVFEFVNPSTIANGDGVEFFPTATLARKQSGVTGHFYYENTANKINRTGFYGTTTAYGIYTDGTKATEFQYPITAGNSFNSTYNGDFAPLGLGEESVKITDGTVTITADAQGQLSLPSGTFGSSTSYTNVLRLHVVESFRVKVFFAGIVLQNNLIEDDYYFWVNEANKQPILISGKTSLDGAVQATVLRYKQDTTLSFDTSEKLKLAIYPNPSNGILTISGLNSDNAVVEVFNTIGQNVLTTTGSKIDLTTAIKYYNYCFKE